MQTVIQSVTTASQVIQLAVAPVFLLTGIAAILSVLTDRLGRVVERFRKLNELRDALQNNHPEHKRNQKVLHELHILQSRGTWVHAAITLCTVALLCVGIVIGILFLGSAINWDSSWLVPPLFIFAMLNLIIGLGCFLREISLSKHTFELDERKK